MNASGALIFLAEFFNKAASHKVLKFLVSTQTEHFFAAADSIANLEVCEHSLEKIVEPKDLFLSKNVAKFISDMVWKAA